MGLMWRWWASFIAQAVARSYTEQRIRYLLDRFMQLQL